MKNITVTVDDETYRRARIRAAAQDTSVSALVKAFLRGLGESDSAFERLRREELELREAVSGFSAADRLARDDLHARKP